jgi:hypothetical protein
MPNPPQQGLAGVMKINALSQSGALREVPFCCAVGCDSSPLPPHVASLLLDVARGEEGQGEGEIAVFFGPLTLALSPAAKSFPSDEGTLRGRGDRGSAEEFILRRRYIFITPDLPGGVTLVDHVRETAPCRSATPPVQAVALRGLCQFSRRRFLSAHSRTTERLSLQALA